MIILILAALMALTPTTATAQTPLNPPTLIAYTDKTLYKPGDTVTITVEALDEELKPTQDVSIIITLTDPGQENIADNAVKTNEEGTAQLTITLDSQAADGEYLIEAVDEANAYTPAIAYFTVCSKCTGQPSPQRETTTVTVTTTTATTIRQTTTLPAVTTTIISEQPATRDILITAAVAVLLAIFATQLLIVRRMTNRQPLTS